MKLAINQNDLKPVLKPVLIAITVVATVGLGYLGCQVFGKAAMFTTAGCLGGLGGTAGLVELIKQAPKPGRGK